MRIYTKQGNYKNRFYFPGSGEPKTYKYKVAGKGQRGYFNSLRKAKKYKGL